MVAYSPILFRVALPHERAVYDDSSETLLAIILTLLAEIVVFHAIAVVKKESPFQFVLLA
jgi:hypothetical protein